MAIRVQASFSAGELDPSLHERTNLDKYQTGLAAARNVLIGKTGRLISRMGRNFMVTTKLAGRKCVIYSPPQSGYVIEWGHLYVRVYAHYIPSISSSLNPNGRLVGDYSHALTEAMLPYIHFETGNRPLVGPVIYICCSGQTTLALSPLPGGGFLPTSGVTGIFTLPVSPSPTSVTNGGTGWNVDYAVSVVRGGEESPPTVLSNAGYLMPINIGETNKLVINLGVYAGTAITEMRVYRRPAGAGAFGYIGSASSIALVAGNGQATYKDIGDTADYTHSPPVLDVGATVRGAAADPLFLVSPTSAVYQQRLLLVDYQNAEAIYASRTGLQNNFTRDYPLATDSTLNFKAGAGGRAIVRRMVNNDGLTVFTSVGVFFHNGQLSPTNLALQKKGNWIIDEAIPALAVPGGVLFVDKATNTIRVLAYSNEAQAYSGEELSIYSDHMFTGRKVISWGFHEGATPVLWVIFSDGRFASFTYEPTQKMRAWTRHDSEFPIEYTCGSGVADRSYFVVNIAGTRVISYTVPRYVTADTYVIDPQAYMNESCAPLDEMVSYSNCINAGAIGTNAVAITAVYPDDWSQLLRITGTGLFPDPGAGHVGTILRVFDGDGFSYDMAVVNHISDDQVIVQPVEPFDADLAATYPGIYVTTATISGLSHLNGQDVAVVVDGYIVASPKNDVVAYPTVTVAGGSITLPNNLLGAIIHVGMPYVMDVQTLDIDTVEQRPVLVESKTVNKVYCKIHRARGLYMGANLPANDSVQGMDDMDQIDLDSDSIITNRYLVPVTKRVEMTTPGDWSNNGRVSIRQVDPIHFEILSIIPDLDDQRR